MTADPLHDFGATLRRYRLAAGLTQEELAERAKLSVRGISDLERGINNRPRRETVAQLAEALRLAPDQQAELAIAARREAPAVARSTVAGTLTNLPIPLTTLVGRAGELRSVTDLLGRPEARLVTLTGPGGVGKTRLALRAATDVAARFGDGAVLVDLAPIRDATLLVPTIAGALGVSEPAGGDISAALRRFVQDKRVLLLLDNFEHILDAARDVVDLVSACPSLVVLVTSREALRVRGERVIRVPPLALPSPDASPEPDTLLRYGAVDLFVARAREIRTDFALTSENASQVAAICRRLDGLPLAIELAAVRLSLFTPEALLWRLERRLELLGSGPRDLPARQQTLRASIGWSYDLLSPDEQVLFRRLAVFAGGCALDAAEAVACAGDAGLHLVDSVSSLVDKHLLFMEATRGHEPRLAMLETIREYAWEQLLASGELEATRCRHAEYFLAFAESAVPTRHSRWQPEAVARVQPEIDNLRTALRWADQRLERELGLRLAGALWRLWSLHGSYSEGRRWLERLLTGSDGVAPLLRARALVGLGTLAHVQGDFAQASAALKESRELYEAAGDRDGVAEALYGLGLVATRQRDLSAAASYLEASRHIRVELDDRVGVADALDALSSVAMARGDAGRAGQHFEAVLAIRRELGDTEGLAMALNGLGRLAYLREDYPAAREYFEESAALRRELQNPRGLAYSLGNLGLIAMQQGDLPAAHALIEETAAIYRDLGDRQGAGLGLAGLAALLSRLGRVETAAELFGAAEALREQVGTPVLGDYRAWYEGVLAAIRSRLDEQAFATAWEAGRSLSVDDAIARARGEASAAGYAGFR